MLLAKTTEKLVQCRGGFSPYLKCLGTKPSADFYDNWGLWDGEKLCFCKDCMNKMYNYYLKKTNSEKTALYYTCMQVNVPFIQEVFDAVFNKKSNTGRKMPVSVARYMSELHKRTSNKEKWNDFTATNIKFDEDEHLAVHSDSELEKAWGIQDNPNDYLFLDETFKRYTQGVEMSNPQQEDLYKDLCRDRLLLRKINDGRYSGDETLDKVQSRIAKTMSILKIDQFEKKKVKNDIELILEKQIWEIENTQPAELIDKDEYKDYLGLGKGWYQDVLRAVKNLIVGSKDYPNITRDD